MVLLSRSARGHNLPVILSPDRTPEGLLHFETSQMIYSSVGWSNLSFLPQAHYADN
jgi:hypothetical protein